MPKNTDAELKRLKFFTHHAGRWITALLGQLANTSTSTQRALLEQCGRACATSSPEIQQLIHGIVKSTNNLEKRLQLFQKEFSLPGHTFDWYFDHDRLERLRFEYCNQEAPCACALVRTGVIDLNPTLCECSHGWIKTNFEALLEQPLTIHIVQTVARGADSCIFSMTPSTQTTKEK